MTNRRNALLRSLKKSRAKTARRNYRETGSATRWGTCPRTTPWRFQERTPLNHSNPLRTPLLPGHQPYSWITP